MRNHIWRLKQKLGRHYKLDPKQVQTNLDPPFLRCFHTVRDRLGCKDAEVLRLVVQDWLSHAQAEEMSNPQPNPDVISTKLDALTQAVGTLRLQAELNHPPARTPKQIAGDSPPQAELGTEAFEAIMGKLQKVVNDTDILFENSTTQYLLIEKTAMQTDHMHQLQIPLMGAVWATLMLMLQYVVRKDPGVYQKGVKIETTLAGLRDFYAHYGTKLVSRP